MSPLLTRWCALSIFKKLLLCFNNFIALSVRHEMTKIENQWPGSNSKRSQEFFVALKCFNWKCRIPNIGSCLLQLIQTHPAQYDQH